MIIKTLEGVSLTTITNAFNEAFKNYFVPLQFDDVGMAAKIKSEGIRLDYSVGAFEGNELAGFILHGYDVVNNLPTIYNAGTGVLPGFRGHGITQSMYEFSIPFLQQKGVHDHVLEVIENNFPAIRVYEKMGFEKSRSFGAFKTDGDFSYPHLTISSLEELPQDLSAFVSMEPAWQNSLPSIYRDRASHQLIGTFENAALVGYAVYVPGSGRVKQCAVHREYRRKGVGRALFGYMLEQCSSKPLTMINVDESCTEVLCFLHSINCRKILGLHEMRLHVPSAISIP